MFNNLHYYGYNKKNITFKITIKKSM